MSDRTGTPETPDPAESGTEQSEGKVVSELAAEHQGAEAPFGSDVHPPIDLAEYRRNTGRSRPADES